MAASTENESEILLGNKQLLGVFVVVAFLLAVAFTGGYMLGKSSAEKKAPAAEGPASPPAESSTALVPRTVTPDDFSAKTETPSKPEAPPENIKSTSHNAPPSAVAKRPVIADKEPILGFRIPEGTPRQGQTYVQVAALTHPEALAMADVLRKQNFQARLAPKPGSTTVFRVLVGPARDAGEITATRDALRKIGFREVILQRY